MLGAEVLDVTQEFNWFGPLFILPFTNHAVSIVCWFLVQFVGCNDSDNTVINFIIF